MSLTEDDKKWMIGQFASKLDLERAATKLEQLEMKLERVEMKLERVETNLLTAFHQWASPTEARLRTHTATLRAIDLEVEALSDRIGKLEDPGRPSISLS